MAQTYEQRRSKTEKIEDESLKQSILRGLDLLQEKFGDEWVERIDCDSLDLTSGTSCVLGQVFYSEWREMTSEERCGWGEPYMLGLHELGIDRGAEYGFDISGFSDVDEYPDLQDAWVTILCEQE